MIEELRMNISGGLSSAPNTEELMGKINELVRQVNTLTLDMQIRYLKEKPTWQDMKAIVNIADSMLTHTAWDEIDYPDEQKYYEEVLDRFNKQRNEPH